MDWSSLTPEQQEYWYIHYTLSSARRKRRLRFVCKMLKPSIYKFKLHPDDCAAYLYEPGGPLIDGIDIYIYFLRRYRDIKLRRRHHREVISILAEEFSPPKIQEPKYHPYNKNELCCYVDKDGNYYDLDFVYDDIVKWIMRKERKNWIEWVKQNPIKKTA